jgi:hypothetical protein
MAGIVGTGDFKYRIIEDWAKLPDGWSFKEVAAVSIDAKDNVYAFGRGEHPIMVFDRDGNFLRVGGGQYPRAHGAHMGSDGLIYLTDDGGHFVRKCSLDGKVRSRSACPAAGKYERRAVPSLHDTAVTRGGIASPTATAMLASTNSRPAAIADVVGEPGHGRGEFNIVHTSAPAPMAGLCRRPRKPPSSGVDSNSKYGAVEQSAPPVRALP